MNSAFLQYFLKCGHIQESSAVLQKCKVELSLKINTLKYLLAPAPSRKILFLRNCPIV